MEELGSELGAWYHVVSTALYLLEWQGCRENVFGTAYSHTDERTSLDRGEAQAENFSAFFCCLDVMNSN